MAGASPFEAGVSVDLNAEQPPSKQQAFEAETIDDFTTLNTSKAPDFLRAEFEKTRRKQRHIVEFTKNPEKNRHPQVVNYDESRVVLKVKKDDKGHALEDITSYIHATHIKAKYGHLILAQAPMSNTLHEWYRMLWEQNAQIIVCVTPLESSSECAEYFKLKKGKTVKCKQFTMKTYAVRKDEPVTMYEMRLKNSSAVDESKERVLHIVHYAKWKAGESTSPRLLLKVIRSVWALESSIQLTCSVSHIGIVVHGTHGVKRTGTFALAYMLCKQIRDAKVVSLIHAILTVRLHRYSVMRNRQQFITLLETILHFSADQGLINRAASSFDTCLKTIRSATEKDKETSLDAPRTDTSTATSGTPVKKGSKKKPKSKKSKGSAPAERTQDRTQAVTRTEDQ